MPTALTTACLAGALLTAGSAAAQPAPDAAGAEAAVARLVAAWLVEDWATVAGFVDPETAAAVAHDARFGLVGEDVSADSLRALAAAADVGTLTDPEAGSDADGRAMARVYRWVASLDDAGEPTDTAVMARVLDLAARCDDELTLHLGPVAYEPAGATAAGPGAVDVVGRYVAVRPDGQPDPGESILAVTPVVWEAGRWTVDEQRTDRADARAAHATLNPIVHFLTWSQTEWGYAIGYMLGTCEDVPGPSGTRE